MRAVIQRVTSSSVCIDGETVANIGKGYNILLGVVQGDTENEAQVLAGKVSRLRVFEDENGKMNLGINDVNGSVLVVSQFTLCADCKKGNRPSFTSSASPDEAKRLYELFCDELRKNGVADVQTGVFAADMAVSIENDGPVTIILDTDIWKAGK